MDKALVFGTKDCRFESCQGQTRKLGCRLSSRPALWCPIVQSSIVYAQHAYDTHNFRSEWCMGALLGVP